MRQGGESPLLEATEDLSFSIPCTPDLTCLVGPVHKIEHCRAQFVPTVSFLHYGQVCVYKNHKQWMTSCHLNIENMHMCLSCMETKPYQYTNMHLSCLQQRGSEKLNSVHHLPPSCALPEFHLNARYEIQNYIHNTSNIILEYITCRHDNVPILSRTQCL